MDFQLSRRQKRSRCAGPFHYLKGYADGREARVGIGDYFAFYNERRLHQALGYRAPMTVWREGAALAAYGHVDNANALTTCPQADQKQQTEPLAA